MKTLRAIGLAVALMGAADMARANVYQDFSELMRRAAEAMARQATERQNRAIRQAAQAENPANAEELARQILEAQERARRLREPILEGDEATTSAAEAAWVYGAANVFGKESKDTGEFIGLFSDDENIARLLGNDPNYVYRAEGLPDPFVIPWRRLEVVAKELYDEAELVYAEGDLEQAKQMFERILRDMGSTRVAEQARLRAEQITQVLLERELERQRKLADLLKEQRKEPPKPKVRPFPRQVREELAGILWSADSPTVVIKDDLLKEGDTVPVNREVKIVQIEKNRVVFEFDGREHEVLLDALRPDELFQ